MPDGFDFVPIDLYKAKAHRFQIIGDKLMPALDTIEGLGDKAAEAVVDAAAKGRFLSKDDFRAVPSQQDRYRSNG